MSMAERIRERMEELGKNAKQVSLEAGLNETYVRDLLKSENPNPRLQHIKALAKVLGVSVDWLDTGTDSNSVVSYWGVQLPREREKELMRYARYLEENND